MVMAEANVVTINGKDFTEDELQDTSKYLVAQIRDLQGQEAQLNFKLHQIRAALQIMTNELISSVEEKPEEDAG
jgi:hypothetical protein|tara:strand:- start:1494 stop:1715 length:222 start_codon:yes stop_codon:yes gene_type:complete